jgi:septum formation protein
MATWSAGARSEAVNAPRVLLGSASPRRREILEALGCRVLVRPVEVDEDEREGESSDAYLARVVEAKLAAARAQGLPDDCAVLLVADTTVVLDSAILHKPRDDEDAARMLRTLSDRTHVVTTRFALVAPAIPVHVESVSTRVTFRAVHADEIPAYVASGEGRDKAGGYAIQGRAAAFILRIEGSYGAVVGLPAAEVSVALRRMLGRPPL